MGRDTDCRRHRMPRTMGRKVAATRRGRSRSMRFRQRYGHDRSPPTGCAAAHARGAAGPARLIYTGGCWLFGATGDELATEETPFRPLPAFAWMVPQLRRVLT